MAEWQPARMIAKIRQRSLEWPKQRPTLARMHQRVEKERGELAKILSDAREYVEVIVFVEPKLGCEHKVAKKENQSDGSPRD